MRGALAMPQRDHHRDIQLFIEWVADHSADAILDPDTNKSVAFMPFKTVEEYFETDGCARLKELLSAVFSPDDPPVEPEDILGDYTRVFCILIEIGKGEFIESFICRSFTDTKLPFLPKKAPSHFPTDTKDPDFYERFWKTQWKFCAPELKSPLRNKQFELDQILPIVSKEKIAASGSAMLYKIKLHDSYDRLNSQTSQGAVRNTNTYALKTYDTREAKVYYRNEVAAFHNLKQKQTSGLIGFCGSYTQGDSFNVILEFADQGNLEQYFENTPRPVRRDDIINFWKGMFKTIEALQSIHQVKPTEGPQILHGFHQDIKPANILVISNNGGSYYEWEFKVADLGLSHFKRVIDNPEPVLANDAHGTRTYGAPECYRGENKFLEQAILRIRQNVDIWSLGCVFSEAAIWVSDGYDGILEYRKNRKKETDQIAGFKDSDCFHDGENVLNAVRECHQYIEDNLRKSDIITKGVLDVIEKVMLVPSSARATATQLFCKSISIYTGAEEQSASTGAPTTTGSPLQPPEMPTSSPRPERTHHNARNPNSVTDSIPSDREMNSDINPLTHKYLEEQRKTIEKCKANINQAEEVIFLISKATKSLQEHDLHTAKDYFNQARGRVELIQDKMKSETPSKVLRDLILEQHLHVYIGLAKCEIATIDEARPPLSSKAKQASLTKAKYYADAAVPVQKIIDPQGRTYKALELWERIKKETQ